MNRYILNDFGFFSTKIYVAYLDFMVYGQDPKTYFELPHNVSDESARKKICEFIGKNIGNKNCFFNHITKNLLGYLIQMENMGNLAFWDEKEGNEIMTKILKQIPPEKSLYQCYFETNGQTKLEKILADILRQDSERFAEKLYNWNGKLLIEPLLLQNYYNLS